MWRNPKRNSLKSGGDLFHCNKSIGTQALTRPLSILRQRESLPLESAHQFYQNLKSVHQIRGIVDDLIKYNFGKNAVKQSQKFSASILGVESNRVWRSLHKHLRMALAVCENSKQEKLLIACYASLRKVQEVIGVSRTSDWSNLDKISIIKHLFDLMKNDSNMIKHYLPNMVCLFNYTLEKMFEIII